MDNILYLYYHDYGVRLVIQKPVSITNVSLKTLKYFCIDQYTIIDHNMTMG